MHCISLVALPCTRLWNKPSLCGRFVPYWIRFTPSLLPPESSSFPLLLLSNMIGMSGTRNPWSFERLNWSTGEDLTKVYIPRGLYTCHFWRGHDLLPNMDSMKEGAKSGEKPHKNVWSAMENINQEQWLTLCIMHSALPGQHVERLPQSQK